MRGRARAKRRAEDSGFVAVDGVNPEVRGGETLAIDADPRRCAATDGAASGMRT